MEFVVSVCVGVITNKYPSQLVCTKGHTGETSKKHGYDSKNSSEKSLKLGRYGVLEKWI
jgi:hypothetical protein